jgi:hypothetical protein
MATTNVPAIQFLPTGLSVPTEAQILTGVFADMNSAFGNNLNTALNTPQGQWASAQAAAVAAANAVFAAIVNGIEPDTATQFMQAAIARIYFLNRNPGVATVVQCTCTGAIGTPIPTGAQAQDTSGNLYQCTQGGTIGSSGNVSLTFANVVLGAIPCPASTLTVIYQIPNGSAGWESITNPAPGVVGAAIETPTAFEFRRQNSVAGNAQGWQAAVYGAVFAVPNVIDAFLYENATASPITYGSTNFTLAANSIYVGVIGGSPTAIAQAIWSKKSPGCNTNGNTSETVYDTSGNYVSPPAYTVNFNNNSENPVNCYFAVSITNLSTLPANIVTLVQTAIVNQFTGQTQGLPRARSASQLVALAYAAAVQSAAGPTIAVPVLSIGIGSAFTGDATLVNGNSTLTVTTATTGLLSFGTVVTGTDIPANTYIVQQLTGTAGGVGTYQMSANATGTVSSAEAIVGTPGDSATFGIDQAPTISLSNVAVSLVG